MPANRADRTLEGLANLRDLGGGIRGREKRCASSTRRCPRLIHPRERGREVKILLDSPLDDAREYRVAEARPPAIERGRGRRCAPRRSEEHTSELQSRFDL